LRPFGAHGVEILREPSPGQALCLCPFCGKEKFYLHVSKGIFDCKSGECTGRVQGNLGKFFELLIEHHQEETSEVDLETLSENRHIPVPILRKAQLAWTGQKWLLPIRGRDGKIRDVRTWKPGGKLLTTPSCAAALWGAEKLERQASPSSWVFICEGEWDGMALEALKPPGIVLAVPGAGVFKQEWKEWLANRRVRLCYDADEAGDQGMAKAAKILQGIAKTVEFIRWPLEASAGYDVRDFCKNGVLSDFEELFGKTPRPRPVKPKESAEIEETEPEEQVHDEPGEIRTWPQVLALFKKHFAMNIELETALKIALATAVTVWIEGDPLWIFLVSPPGGLKTELLMSMRDSEWAVCKSSVSARSLVSGWQIAGGGDPSLLPKLNGKVFILKDYTEIKSLHPSAQDEIFGVLRGAFDGSVEKSFGNGVIRSYEQCHFHVLAGATPTIHGDSKATLGERFLKFCIQKGVGFDAGAAIRTAVSKVGSEDSMRQEIKDGVKSFLAHQRKHFESLNGSLPKGIGGFQNRLIAVAQLVSMLRADVERESYSENLRYRPQHEVGTRIGKQLLKLVIGLALVDESPSITFEHERIMQQVAMDTARGFHFEILRDLVSCNHNGSSREELCEKLKLPVSTLQSRLLDLELLGALRKEKQKLTANNAVPRYQWHASNRLAELWFQAFSKPKQVLRIKLKPLQRKVLKIYAKSRSRLVLK
jgi:hypothetical protein